MSSAIIVRELKKSYGGVEALRVSTSMSAAARCSASSDRTAPARRRPWRVLEGYRRRDAGTAEVLGFDPATGGREYRERIGVVLQQSELTPVLTVREVHELLPATTGGRETSTK